MQLVAMLTPQVIKSALIALQVLLVHLRVRRLVSFVTKVPFLGQELFLVLHARRVDMPLLPAVSRVLHVHWAEPNRR